MPHPRGKPKGKPKAKPPPSQPASVMEVFVGSAAKIKEDYNAWQLESPRTVLHLTATTGHATPGSGGDKNILFVIYEE